MLDDYIGARRSTQLHDPVQQDAGGEETAQTKDMQDDAAARSDVQEPAPLQDEPDIDEYIISVEQVRAHFRAKGLQKSKDTVQRWCRSGDLACRKRGVLNRYFTTEASLKKLEAKLLPDMVADGLGETDDARDTGVQAHAATHDPAHGVMQLHAPDGAPARSGMKPDLPLHDAASGDADKIDDEVESAPNLPAPSAAPATAAAPAPAPEGAPVADTSSGEVAHLRAQLASKESEIEFLREEVRAARSERSNVVQISHRMMEAMETMVIGGKVDRLNTVDSTRPSSPPEAGR